MAAGQPVRQLHAAQKLISAAVADGRLGPTSALKWARRAARGEDISFISQLASVGPAKLSAAAQGQLMQQVVDALLKLVPGAAEPDNVDPEYLHLFPPQPGALPQPRSTLYYEQGDPAPHPVDDPSYPSPDLSWDGYTRASGPLRRDRVEEPEELPDDEAAILFPPRNEAESQRHLATRAVIARRQAARAEAEEDR